MEETPIYLDHHATTPLDPRVFAAMKPYFAEQFGNASSRNYPLGWEAEEAVETSRKQVATLIGAKAKEITFTSGATESNNLALFGLFRTLPEPGHLITSEVEHPATLLAARELERLGHRVTYLPVSSDGMVAVESVSKAITEQTVLASLLHTNNEIGTINPVQEIASVLKERGVLFHVDAAQAAGKLSIQVQAEGIDLLSLSAHKFHGPKGAGALYVRSKSPRVRLQPILFGGGQESGLRSGTLNVPALVGLGKACEISQLEMATERQKIASLRDKMWQELRAQIPGLELNGSWERRIHTNLNVLLPDLHRDLFFGNLRNLAYSTGSACSTGSTEASHVLRAIGRSSEEAKRSLRLSLGRFTSEAEILKSVEVVVKAYEKARKGDR